MTEPSLPPPSSYLFATAGGTLIGGLIAALTAWLLINPCCCEDGKDVEPQKGSATVVIEAPTNG